MSYERCEGRQQMFHHPITDRTGLFGSHPSGERSFDQKNCQINQQDTNI
ncbi:hypothetical protein JW824_13870 [bacterium]|nr:hypothetical protein [bacterium]